MTERSPEERAARAQHAEEIFNDPLTQEAFDRCRQIAIDAFLESPLDDDGMRLRARMLEYATQNMKLAFREIMHNGPQAVKSADLLQMPPGTQPKRRVI